MMDLSRISERLRLEDDGIWIAESDAPVSFPPDGHAVCAEIEADSFWHRHRNRCILELLRAFPPDGTLFDVGGGNGAVANAVEAAGFDVALLEPGAQGARNAKAAGIRTVIRSTFAGARFLPQTLSAVGLFDVLEHLENDDAFLGSIRAAVRPGGRVYITVPALKMLWSSEDRFAGHFRRYSVGQMRALASRAGFRVEYATYFFAPLAPLVFLMRALPTYCRPGNDTPARMNAIARRDHAAATGMKGKVLSFLLERELEALRRLRQIPFGSSCLLVAKAA